MVDNISFQKITMPDGKSFTVVRSGIDELEKEFVVNEVSHRGSVFKMYGTYDQCMDWVSNYFDHCEPQVEESGLAAAVKETADDNFHRQLG